MQLTESLVDRVEAELFSRWPGYFVVVEGIDGSGKSVAVKAAVDFFNARHGSVVQTKEPGGTLVGKAIRSIILPEDLDSPLGSKNMAPGVADLLFLAAHQQNWSQTVRPALVAGKPVVSDRWYYSQLVYQMEREVPAVVKEAYLQLATGRQADCLIVLMGDVSTFLKRAETRTGEQHQRNKQWSEAMKLEKIQRNYYSMYIDRLESEFLNTTGMGEIDVAEAVARILERRTKAWFATNGGKS